MTKELVTKKESSLIFSSNDAALMGQMEVDAETYVDETSIEDMSIPRLSILQALSDQVQKAHPDFIKGSEAGDFYNTLTKEVIKGEEGVYFVVAKRRIIYLEWMDRAQGGGMTANYGEDATAYLAAPENATGGKSGSLPNTEIVKTYEFLGYLVNKDGTSTNAIISMSKTQVKKAKIFNSLIRSLTNVKTGKQLPEFAGVYKLTTVPESNTKGSWFSFSPEFAGYTLAIPNNGQTIYDQCKIINSDKVETEVKVKEINDKI